MTTTIHIDDYRLSDQERALLKKIADRLDAWRDSDQCGHCRKAYGDPSKKCSASQMLATLARGTRHQARSAQPYPGRTLPWSKLADSAVRHIRKSGDSCASLARQFGVCTTGFTRAACASLGRMSMEAIMIKVRIDVSGAVKKLRTVGAAFDQRRALSEIGDSVLKWTREGFATGGHGKWKRLAANTVADKGHSSPLIRSGKLAGSFKSRVFGNRVVIGTNDSKAPFHEYGTKRHVITARGRLLRFKTVDGPVAAHSVNHEKSC